MNILVIGHAAYDITFPLECFPLENTKNRVEARVDCGGGPAFNAAYLLGKWNMDTTFAGIVGNDFLGKKLKQQLENVNIDTKYLQFSNNYPTTTSIIIANKANGSRTIITHRPKDMEMDDFEIECPPDIILLDGQEYKQSVKLLNKYKDAISIIDAGRSTENIISLSKMVNYVVCSKNFAENVTNIKISDNNSLISIYKKMEEIFPGTVIITLEANGSLYRYNNRIKTMPSLRVKAIDSTGAGDIFHGAFTYAIANNYSLEQAIMIGNIAGALSVEKIGSLNSMPTKEEIRRYYHEFR